MAGLSLQAYANAIQETDAEPSSLQLECVADIKRKSITNAWYWEPRNIAESMSTASFQCLFYLAYILMYGARAPDFAKQKSRGPYKALCGPALEKQHPSPPKQTKSEVII